MRNFISKKIDELVDNLDLKKPFKRRTLKRNFKYLIWKKMLK